MFFTPTPVPATTLTPGVEVSIGDHIVRVTSVTPLSIAQAQRAGLSRFHRWVEVTATDGEDTRTVTLCDADTVELVVWDA